MMGEWRLAWQPGVVLDGTWVEFRLLGELRAQDVGEHEGELPETPAETWAVLEEQGIASRDAAGAHVAGPALAGVLAGMYWPFEPPEVEASPASGGELEELKKQAVRAAAYSPGVPGKDERVRMVTESAYQMGMRDAAKAAEQAATAAKQDGGQLRELMAARHGLKVLFSLPEGERMAIIRQSVAPSARRWLHSATAVVSGTAQQEAVAEDTPLRGEGELEELKGKATSLVTNLSPVGETVVHAREARGIVEDAYQLGARDNMEMTQRAAQLREEETRDDWLAASGNVQDMWIMATARVIETGGEFLTGCLGALSPDQREAMRRDLAFLDMQNGGAQGNGGNAALAVDTSVAGQVTVRLENPPAGSLSSAKAAYREKIRQGLALASGATDETVLAACRLLTFTARRNLAALIDPGPQSHGSKPGSEYVPPAPGQGDGLCLLVWRDSSGLDYKEGDSFSTLMEEAAALHVPYVLVPLAPGRREFAAVLYGKSGDGQ